MQSISLQCGIGTHIDAPAHSVEGAATIDEMPMDQLINPEYVIDISNRFGADNYLSENDL